MFGSRVQTKTRLPVAAGRFYPSEPDALRSLMNQLLASAEPVSGLAPKALIVPHAGFIYSGTVAAAGYVSFIPGRHAIKRIVLIGPSHFVPVPGLAVSAAESFMTPLGPVPVDREAVNHLKALQRVEELEDAHSQEHSLEVQLPFLQTVLGEFAIVPLVAGEATAEQIAQVLEMLWGGPETRLIISSDLSHYHDADTARVLDQATANAIEALNGEALGEDGACGQLPIRGLLRVAHHRGLRARTLALRNSGDTAGPRDRVVGYGAFAFA
jgi:AmmeMemoRadiSam system protein B